VSIFAASVEFADCALEVSAFKPCVSAWMRMSPDWSALSFAILAFASVLVKLEAPAS
jgi:hypothetical protein